MSKLEDNYTEFIYLYRDADNYKNWRRVLLVGSPRAEAESRVRAACQGGEFFVAEQVALPTCYFADEAGESATAADHGWHEFYGLASTESAGEDKQRRKLSVVVAEFEKVSERGWRPREPKRSAPELW